MVLDASQAAPQLPVDVTASGADFVAFTGHKVVGPTGIGVLWGRRELLEQLPPFLGGGEMIETVTMERSTYAGIPHKFEAGTPPIVEAVGLGAAVDYLTHIGMENVHAHEQAITAYALEALGHRARLSVLGPLKAEERGGAISFEIDGRAPPRRGQVLDSRGVAVRAGHHCAKPAHPQVRRAELDPHVLLPLHDACRDRLPHRGPGIHPVLLQVGLRVMNPRSGCALPRDNPRPLQEPAPQGLAGPLRGRGPPRQPHLR